MKDNFSAQAKLYAGFRPHYPDALYDFLFEQVENFDTALDCATGNGQVAVKLAERFKEVHATDISGRQLMHAPQLPNIFYKQEAAEETSFADDYFDMVTVAQAIHWFNFEKFYAEIKRILKTSGLLAVIGYGLIRINPAIDAWTDHLYKNIIGPYWDRERKFIDEAYKTIPFSFKEIETPQLCIKYKWGKEQFTGYLNTWSAFQHYIKANNISPLSADLLQQLNDVWPGGIKYSISFPLFLRAGNL